MQEAVEAVTDNNIYATSDGKFVTATGQLVNADGQLTGKMLGHLIDTTGSDGVTEQGKLHRQGLFGEVMMTG